MGGNTETGEIYYLGTFNNESMIKRIIKDISIKEMLSNNQGKMDLYFILTPEQLLERILFSEESNNGKKKNK